MCSDIQVSRMRVLIAEARCGYKLILYVHPLNATIVQADHSMQSICTPIQIARILRGMLTWKYIIKIKALCFHVSWSTRRSGRQSYALAVGGL